MGPRELLLPVLLYRESVQATGDLCAGKHSSVPRVQVQTPRHRQQTRENCKGQGPDDKSVSAEG